MKRRIALALAPALLTGLVLGGGIAHSAPTKHKKAVAKKPAAEPGRLGTPQMAGGDGHFGQTYTLTDDNGVGPYNFTLTSAEYAVGRYDVDASNSYAVPTGQKFLIIHYRVKNPTKQDFDYYPGPFFQTVDADGTTVDSSGSEERESQHQGFGEITLKPGQGIDDLRDYAVVTGKGPLTKIIIKLHRVGMHEEVLRFPLGVGTNIVKPIPAPYADPADPTGATPLAVVPATMGTTYAAGYYDLSLNSVAYAPGPFGDTTADDGNQFVVATVTVTNKTWGKLYLYDSYTEGTLMTSDGTSVTADPKLLAKRNDNFGGIMLDPDGSITMRLLFQIPKDSKAKSLKLDTVLGGPDGNSQAFQYDLSGLK